MKTDGMGMTATAERSVRLSGVPGRTVRAIAALAAMTILLAGCTAPWSRQQAPRQDGGAKSSATASQTLNDVFGDRHVAACVAKVIGQSAAKPVDPRKAEALDALNFPLYAQQHPTVCGSDLASVTVLQGLDVFPNLRYLDAGSMPKLVTLKDIDRLDGLEQVNLYGTSVDDVTAFGALPKLSQVALNDRVCDLTPLKGLPLKSVSVECPSADIAVLDGKSMQIVVHAPADEAVVRRSAASGNTVTVRNEDGSFDTFQSVNGEVQVTHI